MNDVSLKTRYEQLSQHLGWGSGDTDMLRRTWPSVAPLVPEMIEDFYARIRANSETAKIITGGTAQIERLKGSLTAWIEQLFTGATDDRYLSARRQIGKRHVAIGLPPSYTNIAMARLRLQLCRRLTETRAMGDATDTAIEVIGKRMELDLALISDAYQAEFYSQQQPVNQSRIRQQRAIVDLSHRALSASQLSGLFEFAVLLVADSLAADQCTILEWQEHLDEMIVRASFGFPLPEKEALTVKSLENHHAAHIVRERRRITVDDCRMDRALRTTPLPGHETVVSVAGVPLWMEERPWGVLLVHTQQHRPFVAGDQDFLQAVANVLSASLGRRQTEGKMLQAERLAAIGQMITGIAHESRNALQRIQACTEMLQLELPSGHQAMHLIERIGKAQLDLTLLFDEVRGYAAPVSLHRETVDLRQLWRNAWSELQPILGTRSMVLQDERLDGIDLTVQADPFRLTQVFRNLFENAITSGNDETVVSVQVEVQAERHPRSLRIQVCDNGPGFTEAARIRAFDPFFTTRAKGTGLGLAISRRIVEAHGGSITIDNQAETGACVVIDLPRQ